jgi:hypothetical protein
MVKEVVRIKILHESIFLHFQGLVDDYSEEALAMEEGRFPMRSRRVYQMEIV